MAYLEELLMRQALTAQDETAARALLRRLQAAGPAAPAQSRSVSPSPERVPQTQDGARSSAPRPPRARREMAAEPPPDRPVPPAMGTEPPAPAVQDSTPVQRLLARLSALTGQTALTGGEPGGLAASEREAAATAPDVNWRRMERRLQRAVTAAQPAPAPYSAHLPSEGPRSMEPYGQADAAALSRLYERDARRYDGCFELPL